MGMFLEMEYLLGTDLMWTFTRLGYFIYKLLTYEIKENIFCSRALG